MADLDRMEQRPDGSNIGGIGIGHDCTIDTVVGRLSHDNRVEWMKKCVYGFPKGWRGVDEQGRIIGA